MSSFSILRMINISEVKESEHSELYFYTAIIGLVINIIGIFIFSSSGEEEGGHGM